MKVKVGYGLTALSPCVDDHTVAIFLKAQFAGNFNSATNQNAPHGRVLDMRRGGDMPFGDHEKMRGRLGINITKDRHVLILIDEVRGYLSIGDLTKDTAIHDPAPLSYYIL